MGVESDRLVFDYLSRVGDLAQTTMPAAQRMQLVAQLRNDIDRQRGGSDSPATVRRILGRIGTPDQVVEAAAESGGPDSGPGAGPRAGTSRGAAGGPQVPVEPPPGSYGPYSTPATRGEARRRQEGDDGRERRGLWGRAEREAPTEGRGDSREGGTREGGSREGGTREGRSRDGADAAGERGGKGPGDGRRAGGGRTAGRVPGPRRDGDPDWWRIDRGADRGLRAGDEIAGLPGMTGSVFIPVDDEELDEDVDADGGTPGAGPRLRKRPQGRRPAEDAGGGDAAGAAAVAEPYDQEGEYGEYGEEVAPGGGAGGRARCRLLPGIGRLGRGWGSPVLLLAAGLLLAGAAVGSLIPLGLGWAMAYLSRRLTRPQAKFAVLGIPGAAAAGMLVWVWGRDTGKWGAPIAQGHMGQAFQDAYPATVRLAALASALYLLWRSRRTS